MTQRPSLAVPRALRDSRPPMQASVTRRPLLVVPRALRDPWVAASFAGLVVLLALIAIFGQDAGIIWDEGYQLEYGERVLRWFQSRFQDRSAMEFLDLYLYGGLWDLPAQLIVRLSPLGPFETRHILSALTALVGVWGTWEIAAAVGGSRAGFFAALMLVLTPAWIGHGLFNPKDIPFGTASVFVTLSSLRMLLAEEKVRIRDAAWAGVALGVALGIRPGGFFLVAYPIGAICWRGWRAEIGHGHDEVIETHRADPDPNPNPNPNPNPDPDPDPDLALNPVPVPVPVPALALPPAPNHTQTLRTIAGQLALMLAIAWAIMLVAWPWAQLAPFSRPFEAMAAASRFNWSGEVLFDGEFIPGRNVPISYLPVWFGITLPEIYWVAGLIGITRVAKAIRTRDLRAWLGTGMIAVSAVLPLAAAIVTRPTLYDAHRHFLFLLPPLAALAGIALASFTLDLEIRARVRRIVMGVWLFAALLVAVAIVQLHPYEYVFFNLSIGGLPGAVGRYETDYWGASYREGLEWTLKHVSSEQRLRVAGCDRAAAARLFYYVQRWPEAAKRLVLVDSPRDADIYLAVTRTNCHRRVPAEVLHVIERQKAPLLYILHPKK